MPGALSVVMIEVVMIAVVMITVAMITAITNCDFRVSQHPLRTILGTWSNRDGAKRFRDHGWGKLVAAAALQIPTSCDWAPCKHPADEFPELPAFLCRKRES
jgi:hypothetical protein